jgi:hypothetical protein
MVTEFGDFETGAYDETEKELFSIVTEQLRDHDNSEGEQAVQRLADAVVAFCTDKCSEDGFDTEGILDLVLGVIVDIASFVHYDDAAHDDLVQCVIRVRKHGDLQIGSKGVGQPSLYGARSSWVLTPK